MLHLASRMLSHFLSRRGRSLISSEALRQERKELAKISRALFLARIGIEMAVEKPDEFSRLAELSGSQLGQDMFAYLASGQKQSGFFVEFGAGDGIELSNTVMLERELGWTGILAEPLPDYHDSIKERRSAALDTRCVWSRSGERVNLVVSGYLSTIDRFRNADLHASARAMGKTTLVDTVSLWDLLEQNGAPRAIDFLSIDTEGSEYEILSAFPFGEKYSITAIACEHNYSSGREAVRELLLRSGYEHVAPQLSAHDDWFVLVSSRRK